jgi:hypothetical protein
MLESNELSAEQKEIVKLELKKHQQVAKVYENLIRQLRSPKA